MEVLEIPDDDDSSPTGATGAGEVQDASTSGIRSPQVEDAFSSRMRLCSRCKEPQEVLKGKLLICLHSFCEPCLDKLREIQGSTHSSCATLVISGLSSHEFPLQVRSCVPCATT